MGKGEDAGNRAFSPFPTMFSTLSKRNFYFSVTFILSSANPSNFDQSKILSFGKELTDDLLGILDPLPDDKILDWSKLQQIADDILTLSQTSPGFYMSALQVL